MQLAHCSDSEITRTSISPAVDICHFDRQRWLWCTPRQPRHGRRPSSWMDDSGRGPASGDVAVHVRGVIGRLSHGEKCPSIASGTTFF